MLIVYYYLLYTHYKKVYSKVMKLKASDRLTYRVGKGMSIG